MRAAGLSWLGAACLACAVAAGGLELHAEAAEREAARTVALAAPAPAQEAPNVRQVVALSPAAPMEGVATAREIPKAPRTPSREPAVHGTQMGEEEAALHLAGAWRGVLGKPPPARALSLLWAHWAHETGRGRRMYGYNFGGLKGRGPEGAGFLTWTREATGDSRDLVQRTFRAYPSAEAGARDYLELLAGRFPAALRAARRGDVAVFVEALSSRGYFTDDAQAYGRAIASLNYECRRRGLAESALRRLPSASPSR